MKHQKLTPTMLIILDGFGYRAETDGNAIKQAHMPFYSSIITKYPSTLLTASGRAVGLPEGFIGNSEVGHRCMGAGRVIETVLSRFNTAIRDGSFFSNPMLTEQCKLLKQKNGSLHLMGLLCDAGVHSYQEHLYALIKLAKMHDIKSVYIHAFLDGRDTPPQSALEYLQKFESVFQELQCGTLASIHGRFFAMDRDRNWDRTQKSYDVLAGKEQGKNENYQSIIEEYYKQGITDEFIPPTLLNPSGIIKENDGIFFFNYRADRARQLSESFLNPGFSSFPIQNLNVINKSLTFFISTTLYKSEFATWGNKYIFEEKPIEHTLLDELVAQIGPNYPNTIYSIAETEKYAHITYFFKGEKEQMFPGQTQVLIPSKKVKTYSDCPEMSAHGITESLLKSLRQNPAYFYLVNYANADMVGHSGNLKATIKACEYLDTQLELLYKEVVVNQNGTIFITADHGKAEEMESNDLSKPKTAHSTNSVPFIIISNGVHDITLATPDALGIANIAPTILKYLGLMIPVEMELGLYESK